MSKPDVKATALGTPRFLYGFFTGQRRSIHPMDDLWFVGLTLLLAALTWAGVALFDRLMRPS